MFKCVLTVLTMSVLALGVQADDGDKKSDKKRDKPDPEAVFKRLDTDTDGKLSKEEFSKFGENAKKAGKGEKLDIDKLFEKLDTGKDGSISLEEFKQLREIMGGKGKDKKRDKNDGVKARAAKARNAAK